MKVYFVSRYIYWDRRNVRYLSAVTGWLLYHLLGERRIQRWERVNFWVDFDARR
jgi:hypothetical protein